MINKETSLARLIIRYFLFGAVVFAILAPPGTALIVIVFLVFKYPIMTALSVSVALGVLIKTKHMTYMSVIKEEFIATKRVVLVLMKKIFVSIKKNLRG